MQISIHVPLARDDICPKRRKERRKVFQSTSLLRGTTPLLPAARRPTGYFNPRPSCEGRRSRTRLWPCSWYFNPRPSCEGRRGTVSPTVGGLTISIHVPLARDDLQWDERIQQVAAISIHVPLARDDPQCKKQSDRPRFQSTSLLRGTTRHHRRPGRRRDISIHVPLARDDTAARPTLSRACNFNPRPSCEGRHESAHCIRVHLKFQSTSLLRGTT